MPAFQSGVSKVAADNRMKMTAYQRLRLRYSLNKARGRLDRRENGKSAERVVMGAVRLYSGSFIRLTASPQAKHGLFPIRSISVEMTFVPSKSPPNSQFVLRAHLAKRYNYVAQMKHCGERPSF